MADLIEYAEKAGLPLYLIALGIVSIQVFGWMNLNESIQISWVTIQYLADFAAAYLVINFLVSKYYQKTVYPKLHPDMRCNNPKCNSKDLIIQDAKIKCNQCNSIYYVGKQSRKHMPENKPLKQM